MECFYGQNFVPQSSPDFVQVCASANKKRFFSLQTLPIFFLFLRPVTTVSPYPDCNELMIESTACVLLADVVLLVDSSSRIAPSDYKLMKDALAAAIYNLVIT